MPYTMGGECFLSSSSLTAVAMAGPPPLSVVGSWVGTVCSGSLNSSSWPLAAAVDTQHWRQSTAGGEMPRVWTNKDLSNWCLSGAQLSHTGYDVTSLTLFGHNLRFFFLERVKKYSKKQKKSLIGAWWSQGFLYKLQYLKFSFIKDTTHRSDTKSIVVTVKFYHLQLKESVLFLLQSPCSIATALYKQQHWGQSVILQLLFPLLC